VRPDPSEPANPSADEADPRLEAAINAALDGLLRALELDPLGGDRFRALHEPARFADRVFGGQVVAQALLAASHTTAEKSPHSLHAYFVETGNTSEPIELAVERVRDGRSISTRRVTAVQGQRTLLMMMASFHSGPTTPEFAAPVPAAPSPDELPLLQDWVHALPPEARAPVINWVEQPPPFEMRIGEAPSFMGGPRARTPRAHWLRLPRSVGEDPLLHTALLAYGSDYLLMDMVLRAYPEALGAPFAGFSVDHALWFHRPVRIDRWHLYTQEAQAIAGHRGLARGFVHDAEGHLVASAMQENLLRPAR